MRAFRAQKGGGFRWKGEHWNIDVPTTRVPQPRGPEIPIWVAAVNRGMIAASGSVADGLVDTRSRPRRWHREVTLPTLRPPKRRRDARPAPALSAPYVMTSIQRDRELAIRDAKNQIASTSPRRSITASSSSTT